MKKCIFLPLIILSLIFTRCQEDENNTYEISDCQKNESPTLSVGYELDLNNDSVNDCRFDYKTITWDGVNSYGDLITAVVSPSVEYESISYETIKLFVVNADEVIYNDWEESILNNSEVELINISDTNGCWENEWQFVDNTIKNPCFVGVKVKTETDVWIGWLKLNMDLTNGEIKVVDSKITYDSFTVIGE